MKRTTRPGASRTQPKDRASFSLYPSDVKVIDTLIAGLAGHALKVDAAKVIRCLLHTTAELDLFAYAVIQHREDGLKEGAREKENIAERLTVEQLKTARDKLERVIGQLAKKGIKMNDSYVLRSFLRRLPPLDALVPVFKRYGEEFPDGRSRVARLLKERA
jgi:hypothetical protein